MRVVTHPCALKRSRKPVVLAVGFFDGVHRGHQAVLARTTARARELGGSAWALTFDTHPLKVVRPQIAPRLLTSTAHKVRLLQSVGLDGCLVMPFTEKLARTDAEAFVLKLRACIPALVEVFVGRNWRFGRGGRGNPDTLAELGRALGFRVRVVPPVLRGGRPISSTRIREQIAGGHLAEAQALLGRPFSVVGTVKPGRRVGRKMGYPTANLDPHNEVLPPRGVYAVRARVGRSLCGGVLNYGVRPTFRDVAAEHPVAELHLFDWNRDLYGREVEVFFVVRIRGERRFADVRALQRQIAVDASRAALLLRA
jgi:riboflavin kinase/FMN adenylyltransferase